jgi:hypothetical protein
MSGQSGQTTNIEIGRLFEDQIGIESRAQLDRVLSD